MSTSLLDRLLFAQGGLCFFCKGALARSDASIEHLLASSKGGSNTDENRVACCKTVNALLGSMSLKDKFEVMLLQKGRFNCPNHRDDANSSRLAVAQSFSLNPPNDFAKVVTNLKQRGTSRPRTIKTLRSTIEALFGKSKSETELTALIDGLQSSGKIVLTGQKVTYSL